MVVVVAVALVAEQRPEMAGRMICYSTTMASWPNCCICVGMDFHICCVVISAYCTWLVNASGGVGVY